MASWCLTYDHFDPEKESLHEALCTVGNGYFASRGAGPEAQATDISYPGTYLAGGYNRLGTEMAGRVIENEDLVNWPNWLPLTFRPVDGDWFRPDDVNLLDFSLTLDLSEGLLQRDLRFRDPQGRDWSLTSRRIVHMCDPHLAAIEWRLKPHDWEGEIEIRSALDGTVRNGNVERYSDLNDRHLEVLDAGFEGEDGIYLSVQTTQSKIRMTQAARTRAFEEDILLPTRRSRESGGEVALDLHDFGRALGAAVDAYRRAALPLGDGNRLRLAVNGARG